MQKNGRNQSCEKQTKQGKPIYQSMFLRKKSNSNFSLTDLDTVEKEKGSKIQNPLGLVLTG